MGFNSGFKGLISKIVCSSEYLCSAGRKFCNHSTEFLVCVGNMISRFDEILSHMMNKNVIIPLRMKLLILLVR